MRKLLVVFAVILIGFVSFDNTSNADGIHSVPADSRYNLLKPDEWKIGRGDGLFTTGTFNIDDKKGIVEIIDSGRNNGAMVHQTVFLKANKPYIISYDYEEIGSTKGRVLFYEAGTGTQAGDTITDAVDGVVFTITGKDRYVDVALYKTAATQRIKYSNIKLIPAPSDQTPDVYVHEHENHVKVEWAVEMLDEDVLYETSFEDGEEIPDFRYPKGGNRIGTQSITTEQKYSGKKSYKIEDTIGRGNAYNPPSTYSNVAHSWWGQRDFSNGDLLSISFRAKTTNEANIQFFGDWQRMKTPMELKHLYPTVNKTITVTEDANAGSKELKVSDTEGLFGLEPDNIRILHPIYLYFDKTYKIEEVYPDQKKITLTEPLGRDVKKGEVLKTDIAFPFHFNEVSVYASDGWKLINSNAEVDTVSGMDWSKVGSALRTLVRSVGTTYIDDVKMGYATKVQVFRNAQNIYEGYLSEYIDTTATDKTKPDKVTDFNVERNGEKTFVQITKPKDNGTTYNYMVRAISNIDGTTFDSETKSITVTSGVKGYSYMIDDNPNSSPNGNVNSTNGKIEIPMSASKDSYLHIQTVDNEGNKSETLHIPLKDILEEKLDLTVPDKIEFDEEKEIIIGEQIEQLTMSFDSNVYVESYHQSKDKGWELNVYATPFELVNGNHSLPKGTMSLKPVQKINKLGETIGNPKILLQEKTVIDNGKVNVLRAEKGEGIGKFEVVFPEHAIEIIVDSTMAKKGKYRSVIVWELSKTPISNN